MADPKAPEIEGWKWDGYPSLASYTKRNLDVTFDGTDLETCETVSGYGGYTARVSVSLPLLRALMSHLGLHIVSEADKRVLDACAVVIGVVTDWLNDNELSSWTCMDRIETALCVEVAEEVERRDHALKAKRSGTP